MDRWADFICGGSGYLLSRHVLHTIVSTRNKPLSLNACIARQQGKEWCHYHADWALGFCLKEIANITPLDSPLFKQDLNQGPCVNTVACHSSREANQLSLLYEQEEAKHL